MASEFQHRRSQLFALIGTILISGVVVAGAAIVAQMSGCCGGAPTHGCKFIETNDAAMDVSADAPLPCGFQVCEPGVTTCCLEADLEPPISCIPINQVCKGQSATCAGDSDCVGQQPGTHCCGDVATMKVQCLANCSGDYMTDGTVRVCRLDSECPPELPKCGQVTLNNLVLYVCQISAN